jgi:hypothetical protein
MTVQDEQLFELGRGFAGIGNAGDCFGLFCFKGFVSGLIDDSLIPLSSVWLFLLNVIVGQ